jgi:hypothetical protein
VRGGRFVDRRRSILDKARRAATTRRGCFSEIFVFSAGLADKECFDILKKALA